MGIKAEYNPSTGLMHFTAATGKVQVVDGGGVPIGCSVCDPKPSTLQVVVSGVTSCCYTDYPIALDSFRFSEELFTAINSTHVLNKVGPSSSCLYGLIIEVTDSTAGTWHAPNEDCTGTPDESESFYGAYISVSLSAGGIYECAVGWSLDSIGTLLVPIQEWTEEGFEPCWDVTFDDPADTSCGVQSAFEPAVTSQAIGGTVILSEVP